jgi:hypothetical protein
MMSWRHLVKEKDWTGVADLWPHLERTEAADLLDALRAIVPMVTIENGMERLERTALPSELKGMDKKTLKGAAKILYLGELAAYVEGDPPNASAVWNGLLSAAESFLLEASAKAEPTEGSVELSLKRHCDEATESLRSLTQATRMALAQMKRNDEKKWLQAVIAEVAVDAYLAGRHIQAAWGKEFESHAVRGEKVLSGSAQSGAIRRNKVKPKSQQVLAEMERLIDVGGHSVSRAAELAFEKNFGTSKAANRKLFARQKRQKIGT